MTFESLASSSHGNAYLVSDRDTRILLECGLPLRRLQKMAGFQLSALSGVLLSHEHKDHSHCAGELLTMGIPVYTSQGTADALALMGAHTVTHGAQFAIGTLDIVPFTTFHDAVEPLGFLIRSRVDGEVLAFATDTVNLGYRFPGVNILAIEANYDQAILARCERIPEKVRQRITCSHMEIDVLCKYLRTLDLSNCRAVYLLHLSDATSHEGHFINKVRRVVPPHTTVSACGR